MIRETVLKSLSFMKIFLAMIIAKSIRVGWSIFYQIVKLCAFS